MTENTKAQYDAIGTASSAATLTDTYTDNSKVLIMKYLNNIHLDIRYTPKSGQTDRYAYIKFEVSNDDGSTYFEVAAKSTSTQQIKLYNDDFDGNAGIPIIVPGDKTSTGGTAYDATIDEDIVADKIKISVKESGSSNFGTLYVRATLRS